MGCAEGRLAHPPQERRCVAQGGNAAADRSDQEGEGLDALLHCRGTECDFFRDHIRSRRVADP